MCLYVLSSVLWCPLRFPHKNYVLFVFNLQLFVEGIMSYLRYLCLFAHSGVQHILCFCFVFLRLVYPMLPVSLLIAPSVFSNVCLQYHFISFLLSHRIVNMFETSPLALPCFAVSNMCAKVKGATEIHTWFYYNIIILSKTVPSFTLLFITALE